MPSASPSSATGHTTGGAETTCASLAECDLGVAQRLALMAMRHRSLVRDLPHGAMAGDTPEDRAYGEFLLVSLLRHIGDDHSDDALLRAFADHPLLLAPPDPDHVTHDCPICGRPALFSDDRFAVCDHCAQRARCSSGHLVSGWSADEWGHFQAFHADADATEECHSVTEHGRCWIGDCECHMVDARSGGVHVEIVP